MCSLEKFSSFLNVVNLYHVEKCGKNDCGTCKFICKLRYLYIGDVLNEVPGVENLHKYCKNNYDKIGN